MASKIYSVIISDRAATMLVNHVRFMAQISVSAAKNLHEEIITESKSLQIMPERNPVLNDPNLPVNRYRKKLVNKRYLLIYQIRGDKVLIDHIIDCRQDYKWLI